MDHETRLARAYASIEGLSVGDAFGGFFEFSFAGRQSRFLTERRLPPKPWRWTDDTNMALSIVSVLRQRAEIDQDALAYSFAERFDPGRGYGMGARSLLMRVGLGADWRTEVRRMFGGTGSYGNGGAMRVAPLGAYFADDLARCVEQARLSAEVTHAHAEGIAGTIAAAVAAALATNLRGETLPGRRAFIEAILPHIPESVVREKTVYARDLPTGATVNDAASALGNGQMISAQDTVPFCLWCAGEHLADYEGAMWAAAEAAGDVDTNCAIIGGIIAAHTGADAIPAAWRAAREPLPAWAFEESSAQP